MFGNLFANYDWTELVSTRLQDEIRTCAGKSVDLRRQLTKAMHPHAQPLAPK